MLFIGAIFVAYFCYRLREAYFEPFRQEQRARTYIFWIGFVNTLVLLTSSLTVVLAIRAATDGQDRSTSSAT